MPCYGFTNCSLCDIPVCPDTQIDTILEGKLMTRFDKDFYYWVHKNRNNLKWLYDAKAIYKNGDVFDITYDLEGLADVLRDKNNRKKRHSMYCSQDSALFVHNYCWERLLELEDIPVNVSNNKVTNLWLFLACHNLGINAIRIEHEGRQNNGKYHHQSGFAQYEDQLWLLENPERSEKNAKRIQKIMEKMYKSRDFDKDFHFIGFRLKKNP